MKRFFSVLIIIAISISGIVRAQTMTDVENTKYEKAYTLLDALDIIESQSAGTTAGIDEYLTRGKFAQMTVKTFGYDIVSDGKQIYDDVDPTTQEGICIDILYRKGFISQADNFYPGNNIKFNEAVKIIAAALGAEFIAESYGGYPNGYIRYADNVGLLKNMIRTTEDITMGEAFILLYNALNTPMYNDISFIFSDNAQAETLLKSVYNIETAKGIVNGTDKTRLYTDSGVGEGYVEIGNTTYIISDKSVYDYLGYEVEFYYIAESDEEELVTFLPTSRNRVTVINSYNLISASNNRVVYTNHYDKETSEKISENSDYILNGISKPLKRQSDLMIDNGQLKLIDNNGDGVCDVIISESYVNYIVSLYSGGKIYTKDSKGEIDIDYLEQNGIVFDNKEEFEDIKEFTVLSVYADCFKEENSVLLCDFENAENVQINISNNAVYGYINSMDDEHIVIDDVAYSYSTDVYEMLKNSGISIGMECTVYLDIMNRVAYFDKMAAGSIQTGILGRVYFEDGTDDVAYAKIFTENSQWKNYVFARKITINGDRKYSYEAVDTWMKIEGGQIPAQLILYKLNDSEEIIYMDTSEVGDKEDKKTTLTDGFSTTQKFRTGSSTFEGNGGVPKDTKLYVVPGNLTTYTIDSSNAEKFQYYSSALSYLKDNTTYTYKTFCVDEAYTIKYLLIYVASEASADVNGEIGISVFDSISMGLNNDDETVYIMNYYDRSGNLSSATTTSGVIFYKLQDNIKEIIDPNTLERGDIIRIDTTGGMVGAIQYITSADTDTPVFGTTYAGGGQGGYIQQVRVTCGRVYAKNGTLYSIYYGNDIESLKSMENAYTQLEALNAANVKIIIYDREDNTITSGTTEDITDYVSTNNKNNYIFQSQVYGTPEFMMIVR